ncbi:MAG: hypothetical protein JST21_03230 [Bacteroidetes bacterium]|nr:hypothetical protein [Bacteroidota bacterium]
MNRKKEYDYIVTLKHPNYKIYNLISVLTCMITLAAEAYGIVQTPFATYYWVNILMMVYIIYNFTALLTGRSDGESVISFKWSLYAAAFLWLMYPLHIPVIGIFFIVAALLERQIKFPQEIGFSNDGITFNTFPFKHYNWDDVRNVVLKDDIITIDFTNNKIIQREIEPAELTEEENEFNEFCNRQLNNLHTQNNFVS